MEQELSALDRDKTTSKEQLIRVRVLLRDYGMPTVGSLLLKELRVSLAQAIRDYELILKDQFQPPARKKLYAFHETLLPTMRTRMNADPNSLAQGDNTYRDLPIQYSVRRLNHIGKIFGAVFGGLVLVIPMIIMTIHSSVTKSLTASSLSVVVIAIAIITLTDGTWRDVLGITAAYAAVLVVFVGTSVSCSS
jgi:hypothetical protein